MDDNIHVAPLRELAAALKLECEVTTPNVDCAQVIIERLERGKAVRFLCITVGATRVMWTVGHPGVGSSYGDHPRGKTKLGQFVVAINATIDRSFAQP